MKNIAVIILFVNLLTFTSVGQTVEKKIASEACACFDLSFSKSNKDQFMNKFMEGCLKQPFFRYKQEILTTYDIKDTTAYEVGYKMGQEIVPKIFHELILGCDKFYFFFDSLRLSGRMAMSKEEAENGLEIADKRISEDNQNSTSYTLRGLCNFRLDRFDEAKMDLGKAIELGGSVGNAYLYLGWIKEIEGDLSGAKSDYYKCAEMTGDKNMKLLISIIERKELQLKRR